MFMSMDGVGSTHGAWRIQKLLRLWTTQVVSKPKTTKNVDLKRLPQRW
jgi:hypothetical protein